MNPKIYRRDQRRLFRENNQNHPRELVLNELYTRNPSFFIIFFVAMKVVRTMEEKKHKS